MLRLHVCCAVHSVCVEAYPACVGSPLPQVAADVLLRNRDRVDALLPCVAGALAGGLHPPCPSQLEASAVYQAHRSAACLLSASTKLLHRAKESDVDTLLRPLLVRRARCVA